MLNRTRGSGPANKQRARLLRLLDVYLRVDGEEFGLAEVIGAVVSVVVVVEVVDQRLVAVLVVQRTRYVEFLVDDLTTESQSGAVSVFDALGVLFFWLDFGGSPR